MLSTAFVDCWYDEAERTAAQKFVVVVEFLEFEEITFTIFEF